MKIEYTPKIEGTKIMPFVIDAYIKLRQAGNIEGNDCPASGDEEAFYIVNRSKKVVASLSFFPSADGTYFTVNMGFVLKTYRKKGYYGELWNRLVQEALSRSIKKIIGYHKPGNAAILGFNEKVGRKIKYVCSEYIVEAAPTL